MREEHLKIKLQEGIFDADVLTFNESDRKFLFDVYKDWRTLSDKLTKLKSRAVNLPEGLSEGAFCLEMGTVRIVKGISGANTSFDCYNTKTHERIQVKACSVLPDLTSFGPKSVWDKIYFVDFYRKGEWDGTFDIYEIENDDIYNHKVNKKQTLKEQQLQVRRPCFSIYTSIIKSKNLTPFRTGSLNR